MGIQHTVYDPVAIAFAYQEERVRRRLAVPSTRSAMWEQRPKANGRGWTDFIGYDRPQLVTHHILTAAQAREIKETFATPQPRGTTSRLARKFGVNHKTVADIRKGITWTRLV